MVPADMACPARDPVTPVAEGYDPTTVDWGALVADIVAIGTREPRFCSFVIRQWFHDVGGHHTGEDEALPFDGAADGSVITDLLEAAEMQVLGAVFASLLGISSSRCGFRVLSLEYLTCRYSVRGM